MRLVSMLFDLQAYDPTNRGTRPLSFYLEKGRPTLELNYPMVLLCDATTRPLLEAIRGDRSTIYIEKSLTDYDLVRTTLPMITESRAGNPVYSETNRVTPFYWLVCMMKTYALLQAKLVSPDSHYLWIDLGISHMARGLPTAVDAIAASPRPKIACCFIHYRTKEELYPMESFLRHGGPAAIAASAFTVEHAYVDRLYTAMLAVFYEQVSRGIGHSDEQCLVYVADAHPDWFSFYVGDYPSCLTNYHTLREDSLSVQTHVRPGAARERRQDILSLLRPTGVRILNVRSHGTPSARLRSSSWMRLTTSSRWVRPSIRDGGAISLTDRPIATIWRRSRSKKPSFAQARFQPMSWKWASILDIPFCFSCCPTPLSRSPALTTMHASLLAQSPISMRTSEIGSRFIWDLQQRSSQLSRPQPTIVFISTQTTTMMRFVNNLPSRSR